MNLKTANRLQELRKSYGYSQDALAEKLGISRQAISKWERGESSPDTDNLIALANLYGITLDQLLNGDELPNNDQQIEHNKKENKGIFKDLGKKMLKFPFPFVVVIVYLIIGFALSLWHPGWILFVTIPAYYHFAGACFSNSKKAFVLAMPVPEVAVIVYLLMGFLLEMWHPGWIIFLAIPVFYWIANFYKN